MRAITPTRLRQSVQQLGSAWHPDGPHLIGIRTAYPVPDLANDLLAAARPAPGQCRDACQLGFPQNKLAHPALVQMSGKVRAYRIKYSKTLDEWHFGINVHRADVAGATPRIAN